MARSAPNVCVFAPAPILTVVIERGTGDAGELHIHPGGQGFWVARMLAHLGASPTLVTPLGGETGDVFGHLISDHGVDVARRRRSPSRPARTCTIAAAASARNGGRRR